MSFLTLPIVPHQSIETTFLTLPSVTVSREQLQFLHIHNQKRAIPSKSNPRRANPINQNDFLFLNTEVTNSPNGLTTFIDNETQTDTILDLKRANEIISDYRKHAALQHQEWKESKGTSDIHDEYIKENPDTLIQPKEVTSIEKDPVQATEETPIEKDPVQATEETSIEKEEENSSLRIEKPLDMLEKDPQIELSGMELFEAVGYVQKAKELRLKSIRSTLLTL
jgi:hypothetical protein